MDDRAPSRRTEQAEATREAIIDAAQRLFARQGYSATKVDQVAELARVAPGTVYAVVGGKAGLLRILVDRWHGSSVIGEGLERMAGLESPHEVLELLSASWRKVLDQHGDVARLLVSAAPHDATAAEALAHSEQQVRAALTAVAVHLHDRGALAEGVDVQHAVDVLFFYFGMSAHSTLREGSGWSAEAAERWLAAQAGAALLAP